MALPSPRRRPSPLPTSGRTSDKASAKPSAKPSATTPAGWRFRPDSWSGAFIVMVGVLGLLWVVQLINALNGDRLVRFGIRPRQVDGLTGIVTAPFLHGDASHLFANSVPLLVMGWLVLASGLTSWLVSSAIIILFSGLFTWLVAPSGLIVGASAVVFGWLGYLIARAYFARKIAWIIIAIAVVATFSSMLGGLLPGTSGISWPGHVGGLLGGVLAGWLLHPRKPPRKQPPKVVGKSSDHLPPLGVTP